MVTVISLSFAQEDISLDNSRAEKDAKELHSAAENCEDIEDIFINRGTTIKQIRFALNYEKEGKNPLTVARLKDCENCRNFAKQLEKVAQFVEDVEVLKLDHLTLGEIFDDFGLQDFSDLHCLIYGTNLQK